MRYITRVNVLFFVAFVLLNISCGSSPKDVSGEMWPIDAEEVGVSSDVIFEDVLNGGDIQEDEGEDVSRDAGFEIYDVENNSDISTDVIEDVADISGDTGEDFFDVSADAVEDISGENNSDITIDAISDAFVDVCIPNCSNKDCGDDGCGGVCGECSKSEVCSPLGRCLSGTIPDDLNGKLSYVDWNYLQGLKYRYAASILEEGEKRYLYVCANIDRSDRPVVTDHIVLRIGTKSQSGWDWGSESVVLYPGEKINQSDYIWDYRHVCDPKVIKGEFSYVPPGESVARTYYYALFYTGIDDEASNGGVNSLGWAIAERPEGPFIKVIDPLVKGREFWGIGQPAVTSIDGKGQVLLMYTRGETSGTNMLFRRADLSDANNVHIEEERIIPTGGLTLSDGNTDPTLHGADIVYDSLRDIFWMVRSGHPFPSDCPNFIADYIQVAFMTGAEFWSGAGRWYVLGNLKAKDIGFERLFDPGFVSSPFGTVVWPFSTLSLVISVSHLCPNDLSTYRVLLYDTPIE